MKPTLYRTITRTLLGAAILAAAAGQASAQKAERPKPFAALSGSAQSLRDSLVAIARAQVGTPYRLGGRSPDRGFDCSGFVQFVMSAFKRDVPRTAAQQARVGAEVPRDTSDLQPGDLVTFGRGERVTHIGIYVGNGRFVHASSVAGRVVESRIDRRPTREIKPWRGARRVIPLDSGVVAGG